MTKPQVLFVIGKLTLNGATRSLLALLQAIKGEYDISLFVFSQDEKLPKLIPDSVKILPEKRMYRAWREPLGVILRETAWRFDVVTLIYRVMVALERWLHISIGSILFLPKVRVRADLVCGYTDGFVAEVVAQKVVGAKKRVSWVHQNYEDDPIPSRSLSAFQRLDAAVCVSDDAVRHFKNAIQGAFAGSTHVVHNITDETRVVALSTERVGRLTSHRFNLLTIGRVSREKGLDVVPRAIRLMVDGGLDVAWTIVGTHFAPIEEMIMAQAKELGVGDRVVFAGPMENPYPCVVAADCYVQPSIAEGWGMAISEALVLKKPVVCTRLPVFAEQVRDGENGFLVEWTADGFAEAIRVILKGEVALRCGFIGRVLCSADNVRQEFAALVG